MANQAKKVWIKAEILELLSKNDEMVKRSLVKIYGLQTDSEQNTETTKIQNGIGV